MAGKTAEPTFAQETIAKGQHRTFRMVEPTAEGEPGEAPAETELPADLDGTGAELPPAADEAREAPADPRKRAVRVRASVLRAALKDVAGAVGGRSTIPILANVLFRAGDGRIELVASDLDVWAERDCATDDRDGPGSADWVKSIRPFAVTLPEKPLADILGELDGDAMVTIAIEPAASNADQAVITAGRARFRLHCLPAEDFPLPKHFAPRASYEVSCADLAGAFAAVEHAISSEETRYYLNGVYSHTHQAEGEPLALRFVATDGHRLAQLRLEPPEGATAWPPAIVPRRTVALLDRLLAAAAKGEEKDRPAPTALVEIEADLPGALLRFAMPAADGGDITVTAKSIDGTFPDYQRVIPNATPHSAVFERLPLAEAIKRVGVLASDKTRAVKAVFTEDRVELVVNTPEIGEAREELPCTYAGPEVTIGFNGQYWREALAALASEQVSMAFDDGEAITGPVLVRAAGDDVDRDALVQVLMPMRVA